VTDSIPSLTWQDVEKVIPDLFKHAIRKVQYSDRLHFRWLSANENVGKSLYRPAGRRKTELFNSLLAHELASFR